MTLPLAKRLVIAAICVILSSCGGVTIQIVDPFGVSSEQGDGDNDSNASPDASHPAEKELCYVPLGPLGDAELAAMGFIPRKHPNLYAFLIHSRDVLRPALPPCPVE